MALQEPTLELTWPDEANLSTMEDESDLPPLADVVGVGDLVEIVPDSNPDGDPEQTLVRAFNQLSGEDNLLPHGFALPTALLTNQDNIPIRALFDQGAQRSLIRKSLADKLKLKPISTNLIIMSGINQTKPASLYDLVKLDVKIGDQTVELKAYVTDNLPSNSVLLGYPKLRLD